MKLVYRPSSGTFQHKKVSSTHEDDGRTVELDGISLVLGKWAIKNEQTENRSANSTNAMTANSSVKNDSMERSETRAYDRRPRGYYPALSLKSPVPLQSGIPIRRGCHCRYRTLRSHASLTRCLQPSHPASHICQSCQIRQ